MKKEKIKIGTFYGKDIYSDEKEKIREILKHQQRLLSQITYHSPDIIGEIEGNIKRLKI